jgi:hypothetical protein
MKPTAASPQAARGGATLPLLALAVGAFNLGNALGAAAGGAAISAGFGYGAVPVAGALIAAAGVAFVALPVEFKRGLGGHDRVRPAVRRESRPARASAPGASLAQRDRNTLFGGGARGLTDYPAFSAAGA